MAAARDFDNIRFFDLQPIDRQSDLLGLASVHLLLQIAGAADLVLPSKLTNMLASGRPVVATAAAGSGSRTKSRVSVSSPSPGTRPPSR